MCTQHSSYVQSLKPSACLLLDRLAPHSDTTLQFPLAHVTAVSVFIGLWYMGDKISWLGGLASQWRPPQGLSEHKHCDNAVTTVIRTARTLEAEWRQVYGEAWVRGQRKMSQVLGAFGFLDFTMLRPVFAWRAFLSLWNVFFFNFPNFFHAEANRGYGCPPEPNLSTANTRLLPNTTPTLPTTQKSISQSPPCH